MSPSLVLIHTVKPLIAVFDDLAPRLLPGVKVRHILDEPLLERIRLRGGLAGEDAARLAAHVQEAGQIGADAALVTCSTVSPCVDDIRRQVSIPVVKIDEAMIAQAIHSGERLGVIATNPTTVEPTRRLLEAQARAQGKSVKIEGVLVEHALDALLAGDGEKHDILVVDAVRQLSRRADVIVLAQASTARALDRLPESEREIPVLGSPQLALAQAREILQANE